MSTSIKIAWGCECNPSSTTGYIDGDTDTVYCNACDGVIADVSQLKLGDMSPIEHSRHDYDHYKNCKPCYDDHIDFIQELELDAVEDMKESEGGQCE